MASKGLEIRKDQPDRGRDQEQGAASSLLAFFNIKGQEGAPGAPLRLQAR